MLTLVESWIRIFGALFDPCWSPVCGTEGGGKHRELVACGIESLNTFEHEDEDKIRRNTMI